MLGQLTGKCPLCNRRVDAGAGLCSPCLNRRNMKSLVGVMLVAFAATAYYAYFHPKLLNPLTVTVPAAQAGSVAFAPTPLVEQDFQGWQYFSTIDPLVDDQMTHARVLGVAPGLGNLDIGKRHNASLELRSSTQYGNSVMVTFPNVAKACDANPCQLRVAWDEAPPDPYDFKDISSDGKRTVLLLDGYDRFTDALTRAKQLKLVAAFGMPEDYVVTFPVVGFDPKKKPR